RRRGAGPPRRPPALRPGAALRGRRPHPAPLGPRGRFRLALVEPGALPRTRGGARACGRAAGRVCAGDAAGGGAGDHDRDDAV
ncbi:MAG: hypothetical protein AVDCRST_MAG89-1107, partial [uncultured Gemmatimonadetes bacterium]